MIENYDYFIYGTAAAVVFGQLFFPTVDPLIGTLTAFATFGVGFLSRPIGGVVFSHFGDKVGRKAALVTTLLIMGISTLAIGLLPTYATIGIWAPVLLVVLRLAQGFSFGGEWGGAALMAVEYAPEGKRGLYGSAPQVGSAAGLILAAGVFALLGGLPDEQFLAWGWRVPFLFSVVMVVVGLFIRLRIAETPAFRRVQETGGGARMPLIEVLRNHPRNVLLAMGMRVCENVFGYIIMVFALAYGTEQLGLPRNAILLATLAAASVGVFSFLGFGALSDRVGRRPVYMGGALFSLLFAFPFFWLLNSGSLVLVWLAIIVGYAVAIGSQFGVQPAFFSELFGTRVRYTGVTVGYQIATALGGGFAPFIAAALVAWSGGDSWPVSLYMAGVAAVTLVSAYLATETFRSELHDEQPQDRRQPSTSGQPPAKSSLYE
jgi:metabolite-proton symporter